MITQAFIQQGKQEMDPAIMAQADLLVTDSRAQTVERGEFQHAVKAGLIDISDVREIGELIGQPELHRQGNDDDRLTIFDTSGVAVEDVQITRMVGCISCNNIIPAPLVRWFGA